MRAWIVLALAVVAWTVFSIMVTAFVTLDWGFVFQTDLSRFYLLVFVIGASIITATYPGWYD